MAKNGMIDVKLYGGVPPNLFYWNVVGFICKLFSETIVYGNEKNAKGKIAPVAREIDFLLDDTLVWILSKQKVHRDSLMVGLF